jgi:endonuclease YncB( thermonuclease family)
MRWLILFLLIPSAALADSWSGTAQIVDGDTIWIDGVRLRLNDIDAFESAQICSRDGHEYECGSRATEALRGMIAGQPVHCHGLTRDRYRRPLVVCYAGRIDLNVAMVRAGWAVAEFGPSYRVEEARARESRSGAWAGTFERPKVWRKSHR